MHETPTPETLREFMTRHTLTGVDVAAMSGVDARTARRWVAPEGVKGAKPIPWAAWALIQILTGEKTPGDIAKLIDQWKQEKIGIGLFERGKPGRRWPEKEEKSSPQT